ncbi:MAG: ABC transporter ATP-binding protein [Pseudomonadota bacterium]
MQDSVPVTAPRDQADGPDDARGGIQIRAVSKVFGSGPSAFRALDAVSLEIRANEFFTLLGPSGCGKTTLLRLIAGFEQPTGGEILLGGEEIAHLAPNHRPVNTVFQSYALFPHMTVARNIGFGLEMLKKPKAEVETTVREMLALVRMEHLADRRTDQISGGQQQRVALARALAPHPKVLLLDEPLSALDYKLRKEMQTELKRLQNETGITFVFVTHDQEEALTMSDRLAVMSEGRILQVGRPRDIYHHPRERFVADFIGDTNFIEADVLSAEGSAAQVRLASGGMVPASVPEGVSAKGRVTAAVRPEHARLVPAGEGDLDATLESLTFFGTDTLCHCRLGDGSAFTARVQNAEPDERPAETGARVGLRLAPGAVQILKD